MGVFTKHKEISFGVGDRVRVTQKIEESGKTRLAAFEGIVIATRGRASGKNFIVRRIGEAGIGIEKIFPLESTTLEKVEVLKKGTQGVKKAKLYYIRGKNPKEIEEIYATR